MFYIEKYFVQTFLGILFFMLIIFPSSGQQYDSVLYKIRHQLSPKWRIMMNDQQVHFIFYDSINSSAFKNNYDQKGLGDSEHHEITFDQFDITDTLILIKTLAKIDSLQCILVDNSHCKEGLEQIEFIQYKTIRAEKRAAKRSERKFKKREKECFEYDQAKNILFKLLLETPVFFTDTLALGLPTFNGNNVDSHDFLTDEFLLSGEELRKAWEIIESELNKAPN